MSGNEIACFSGAAQNSLQSWYPSNNYTSLPSLTSNVPVGQTLRRQLMVTSQSLALLANRSVLNRGVALSSNYTTTLSRLSPRVLRNSRQLMETRRSSPRLANTSLMLRYSSLSPSEPKLDKDENCHGDDGDKDDNSDGDKTDYDVEDGADEPIEPHSAGSKRACLPTLTSNVPVARKLREVALSYSDTTLNRRELMVTGLLSPSWLTPSEPKLNKEDDCHGDDADKDDNSDGDNTDYDVEDGDDEPSKPHSAGSKRAWNKEVLMLVFALFFYLLYLFGCTKCLYALDKRTYIYYEL
ncbi:uncharacterized protein LOC143729013 [Siphateles boraxobius]|uniref:uncharacterized protein LOC143729013 n=1 Tax=Siphateles boraxobius TaxID=180520 RepID=UPI004063E796